MRRSTEGGEAAGWQGATTYLRAEATRRGGDQLASIAPFKRDNNSLIRLSWFVDNRASG